MGTAMRVVIYDSAITAMTAPGGDVYRYAHRKGQRTTLLAKMNAPKRSGALVRGIRMDIRKTGRDRVVVRVRSQAAHSLFVHEGTTGPIYAHNPRGLWVPRRKYGTSRRWRESVNGQKANPFLTRAMDAEMRPTFGPRLLGNTNPFG